MLNKFSVALFLYTKNKSYNNLVNLATHISSGLASMSTGPYPSPFPTLMTFDAQIVALQLAITKWGPKGNHGSTADKANLKAAADTVRISLIQLSQYVMDTDPQNPQNWVNAGFTLKTAGSPVGSLAAVVDLRQYVSAKIPPFSVRIKWNRPLGSERARGIKYKVMRNSTNDVATATLIAITSKLFYQYQPPTADGDFYWITPLNSDGSDGAISNSIFANPKKIA